ncbi:MaoC/PaaZ C-terminal domain-containing protein [Propioniciclava tarda]|uniref:Dehydratase n=1 Tax=Propioniciclava tarda TaxID=433330 RepID=A0A4Q9KIU9_PROTD|nr:MaoC/PaaZ C-terminal domain-containing protein [Propioniciclava tarda]TBT94337.1 dehydratase [Propioniciclava tarda]SMO72228.1 Acyl dehydratase [Propioniciclava tarda]HQD61754.1 MaoC/PaaZ C-terminal domain-containing protein [Propioniciclava tarda]
MSELAGVEVGTELPPITVTLTRASLVRYAGASGDFNPIHYSDHFARALGLETCIAHGMLTMGTALRVVTDWCGDPARVLSYGVRFAKPVPVPDDAEGASVTFAGRVTKVSDAVATVTIDALCGEEKVLAAATAEVALA